MANSILIIDDDEYLRNILAEILANSGYIVRSADNGVAGVALFRKERSDIVITDIFMPEKDGLETITELLKEFPGTMIVAMTGVHSLPMDGLKIAGMLGAVRCIKKPFDPDELLEIIRELLVEKQPPVSTSKPVTSC